MYTDELVFNSEVLHSSNEFYKKYNLSGSQIYWVQRLFRFFIARIVCFELKKIASVLDYLFKNNQTMDALKILQNGLGFINDHRSFAFNLFDSDVVEIYTGAVLDLWDYMLNYVGGSSYSQANSTDQDSLYPFLGYLLSINAAELRDNLNNNRPFVIKTIWDLDMRIGLKLLQEMFLRFYGKTKFVRIGNPARLYTVALAEISLIILQSLVPQKIGFSANGPKRSYSSNYEHESTNHIDYSDISRRLDAHWPRDLVL